MKKIEVVAGIITENDKILITRRAPKENFAGGWEFPGGKKEVNETQRECLVRELKEELDVDVAVNEFCIEVTHSYGDMEINLIAYYCTIVGGCISMSVHDRCQWVKVYDLFKYELLPADALITQKVLEDYSK